MRPGAMALACLLAAAPVRALADAPTAASSTETETETDPSQRYKNEGPVVDNAASFIGVMTVLPAAAVGALFCPVKLAGQKVSPGADYRRRYKDCVAAGANGGSQIFYTVGGFPFLVLKRVFWDAPHRVLIKIRKPKKTPPISAAPAR
ncbi:MAG: hypothetical protein HKL90_07570 [Elusimicrobia bacterium]|nr:hypothetical protein [Elusimicrobiota bacterium]